MQNIKFPVFMFKIPVAGTRFRGGSSRPERQQHQKKLLSSRPTCPSRFFDDLFYWQWNCEKFKEKSTNWQNTLLSNRPIHPLMICWTDENIWNTKSKLAKKMLTHQDDQFINCGVRITRFWFCLLDKKETKFLP